MISLRCGQCGKDLKVKDELAGKRVKCPGCGKPVGVPELAASVSPQPLSQVTPGSDRLDEERTLPPAPQSGSEQRTVAPKERGLGESISDADGQTAIGAGRKGNATQPFPEEAPGPELTDFLAPAQADDELGRLGGFRILKVLGHGGMGVVFLGEDPKLGRKVAIKAMLPHLAGSKSSQERFLREAKAAAALEHDHIVRILQVGEDRGAPFIVMPFLQGEPLDKRLLEEPCLPLAEVLRISRQTALGLAAAHKKGLIHRDIKPANIWLEAETQRVKILDFGLARAAADNSHLTQSGAIIGTPAYMAPEQAAGNKVDHRCDLFSFGCVLYRLCTGQMPFKGKDSISTLVAIAMENPKPPAEIRPEVPAVLSDLVMRLLAKNPEERPQSAQEVADALGELLEEHTVETPGQKTKRKILGKPPATAARRKWLLIAAALVLLAAIGGTVFFLGSGNKGPDKKLDAEIPLPPTFTNTLGMEFVLVPRGNGWLGGGNGKPGDKEVEIAHDFYLGKYEVTQEEWEKVTGINPSAFKAVAGVAKEDQKRFPVEMVSWEDAQRFIEGLNKKVKEAGWVYRLPKEAEWEYACRGGPLSDKIDSAFDFYFEKPTNLLLLEQANFEHGKGLKRTCKVGSYQPNRLGLYDMHGNVTEWCDDTEKAADGASHRVNRGGNWKGDSGYCRAAYRYAHPPSDWHRNLGLRLARVPIGKEILKPTPEEKKPAVEGKSATTFAPKNGPIDLLRLLDLPKSVLAGVWKADADGSIRTVAEPRGHYHLKFPVSVNGDYRLKLEFTHYDGMGAVSMILPVGSSEAEAVIGSNNNNRSGFGSVEGKPFNENETTRRKMGFVKEKRNTVVIEVRADAQLAKVTAVWNGDKFVNWSGPVAKLSLPKERPPADRAFLEVSLADRCSNTHFHSVTLEMISGEANLLRP